MHTAQFKAEVLAQCCEPGVSVASVALAHGLNTNLVRKWLVGRGLKRAGLMAPAKPASARRTEDGIEPTAMQFVPVSLAAPILRAATQPDRPAAGPAIQLELRRGDTSLNVQWPASQSEACIAWLREATHALLIP